jgi:hypothetical protein
VDGSALSTGQDGLRSTGRSMWALRYDYFEPKASRPAVEKPISEDMTEWVIDHDSTVTATPKSQFSPRIGVAFLIGPDSEMRVNYWTLLPDAGFRVPLHQFQSSTPPPASPRCRWAIPTFLRPGRWLMSGVCGLMWASTP